MVQRSLHPLPDAARQPQDAGRFDELEKDLFARRDRAEREGWAGEIEGLNLTLALLRSKRDESQRMARRPAVDLGIPKPRTRTLGAQE
ncbi:hypothetical protein ACIQ6R_36910 [Streptomyces sp. NPDC096048]|uniref:hypothetical protein n=1 Tax=Streptomyces sp. NPDC096048 TaxID=3366072 RepID=UPI00382F659F